MTEGYFAQCASLIKQGDMRGLKEIYVEYGKMIYSAAYGVCKNRQTAEDVTSEFFLKLKSAVSVYREGLGHKKWLLASAKNLAIDHIRRQSREIPVNVQGGDEESHPLSELSDGTDTEETVTSELSAKQLLEALSGEKREIVHLKIYCGLTFAEISDLLQIPAGTAAWRYNSAIKELRRLYEEVR